MCFVETKSNMLIFLTMKHTAKDNKKMFQFMIIIIYRKSAIGIRYVSIKFVLLVRVI